MPKPSRRPGRTAPRAAAAPRDPRGAVRPTPTGRGRPDPARKGRNRSDRAWLAVLAVALFALATRLVGIAHGLPDFVEEAIPLRRAIWMWEGNGAGIDWNPHLFHYPSLGFYVHTLLISGEYLLQSALGQVAGRYDFLLDYLRDPSTIVIAARGLHAVAEACGVLAAGWAGERIQRGGGVVAAVLLALSPTMIHTSRSIYVDTLMSALAVFAVERMIAYVTLGGRHRAWTAAVLVGLAGGMKYPALALVVPLAAVILRREGLARRRMALAAALATALVFLATSPFIVLDFGTFASDIGFVRQMAAIGHLGSYEHAGFAYHAQNLARDLGWPGLALCLGSLVLVALPSPRRPGCAVVWGALLVLGVPMALARIEAERYLVTVLPFAAILAGVTLLAIVAPLPAPVRRPGIALLLGLLLFQPLRVGVAAVLRDPEGTQSAARRWCEQNFAPRALVIEEEYGPNLPARVEAANQMATAGFGLASPAAQDRFRARRLYDVVRLPVATVGALAVPVRSRDGSVVTLEIAPRPTDMDGVLYDPRLLAGADYVITSSTMRRRYEADPRAFPAQLMFYALLDSTAEVAARFDSQGRRDGPNLVIYRIGQRAREAVAGRGGLDPLWWAYTVPEAYRVRAQHVVAGDSLQVPGVWMSDGAPSPWVTSLEPYFRTRLKGFCLTMAVEHSERGERALALPYARALLEMDPSDEVSARVYAEHAQALGRGDEARSVLRRHELARARR
jgi:hypothetical protein